MDSKLQTSIRDSREIVQFKAATMDTRSVSQAFGPGGLKKMEIFQLL